ncbi:hypothetical protein EV204_11729 [Tissierella praeacuta]|uniref:hypothetical protein n=1 Tax=Tissierella praeacuta TaxID=43131 RepID=UPI001051DAAF|nr:hypothetical protein [Tissierella praeacuta]TCU65637.1 hypothetical protein EV204_11729 [Tissierella praeacuta]
MKKNINEGFEIKRGRSDNDQYINTKFNFIDAINEYADCETLGFYVGFKSYINREENTKDNQIIYSQKYLAEKLGVSTNYKYYKHLKLIFNAGLIDIEKTATIKFFINYNIEGKDNPLVSKQITFFSTLDNINIPLKNNMEKLINELYPEIPLDYINVVSVSFKNSYIIHDYPPYVNMGDGKPLILTAYRNWDEEMERFKNKAEYTYRSKKKSSVESEEGDSDNQNKGEENQIGSDSNNQKEGNSNNQKHPVSNNQKHNNIIELNNNIIESSNNIINQSTEADEKENKPNKEKSDRLIDIDEQIRNKGFTSYEDLVYNLGLDNKQCYGHKYKDWIETVKKAIYEMYYFDDTKIRGRKISRFDAISKLQGLNYDIIISTIDKFIESSKKQEIRYPSAFIKSTLFNEIGEFSAKNQAMVNYNLANKESVDENMRSRRTKFHNFQGRTDKYSAEELEDIARMKRQQSKNKRKIEP